MNWLLLKKYKENKEKRDNLQFPLYLYNNNNNNTLDLFSFAFLIKKKNANVLSLLLNSLKSIIDLLM
jgi:hypothetical protein